jgi:hypothetical protein
MQMTNKNEFTESLVSHGGTSTVASETNTRSASPRKLTPGWVRSLHAFLGVVSAFNLLLLICSGLLLQHAAMLHLDERTVSRTILPSGYRPQDAGYGVRADIVITDLHSGRLFGAVGALILDVITLAWLVMLATGLVMYTLRLRLKQRPQGQATTLEEDA